MRIVRIRHLFYPDMPKDYFYELSYRQAEKGHEVHVLTWNRKKGYTVEKVSNNFFVHRLSGINLSFSLINEYPYLPSMSDIIRKIKPDIIHAESHLFLPSIRAIRIAKKLSIPCVVSVHGVSAERGFALNLFQNLYLRTIGLKGLRLADKIICLTSADAAYITNLGVPSGKIKKVANGVDTVLFKPGENKTENLVVWVGRFVPEKGVEYLIQAAEIVAKESKQSIKFLLVGYGPLKNKFVNLVYSKKLYGTVVNFAGPFSRAEISEILQKSSLFVLPSLKEGMPLTLLEAMASGIPVVASNIHGINDVITDGFDGLLVAPKQPEQLASAILTVFQNEALKNKLSSNSRRTIETKYSLDSSLMNLENVYALTKDGY